MGSLLLLLAMTVNAPGPAKAKPHDQWVGVVVCLNSGNPEQYRRLDNGTFELQRFAVRNLDVRCIDEAGEYIAVQHEDVVFWLKKESVTRPRDAINHYTAQLDKNPDDDRALTCRAWAYLEIGEFDRGLKDAQAAVAKNPNIAYKNNLGEAYLKRKDYDKAIAEFTTLLDQQPNYFFALSNRGEAYIRTRQFVFALRDVQAALTNNAKVPSLHMNLARILASAPDAKLRDSKQALESAKKAVDMIKYRDGRYLDTLAAAYAENGEFGKAIETQQKAFDDPAFMKEEADAARKRLALYREKKPFRDE